MELHKGYSSPYFGGGLSGVLALYMRDGNKLEHKQSIQAGLTTISGTVEGPIDSGRGSYLLSGRIFSLYPFLKLGYSLIDEAKRGGAPTFNFYDVVGKVSYDLNSKNRLFLSVYSGNDMFQIEDYATPVESMGGTGNVEPDNIDTPKVTSSTLSQMNWGNSVASIRLNSALGNRLNMTNILYYSYLGNRVRSDYTDRVKGSDYVSIIHSNINEYGYKLKFDYNLFKNNHLDFGLQYSNKQFNPQHTETIINDNLIKSNRADRKGILAYSAYVNDNIIAGKFEANIGLRATLYDNGSSTTASFEPRVSLSYLINGSSFVWGSYSVNSQPKQMSYH